MTGAGSGVVPCGSRIRGIYRAASLAAWLASGGATGAQRSKEHDLQDLFFDGKPARERFVKRVNTNVWPREATGAKRRKNGIGGLSSLWLDPVHELESLCYFLVAGAGWTWGEEV